jgi:hypothetical protein
LVAEQCNHIRNSDKFTLDSADLPPQARKVVMGWAARNRAAIAREWNRINSRFPVA